MNGSAASPPASPNMRPKPSIQNATLPRQKSIRFFIMMFPAFFARVKPVSTIANPACMKNTSTVPNKTQSVSTDTYIRSPYKQKWCAVKLTAHLCTKPNGLENTEGDADCSTSPLTFALLYQSHALCVNQV